jgi:hypothetical protein
VATSIERHAYRVSDRLAAGERVTPRIAGRWTDVQEVARL